jgi:TRAP-type C4-dicarboxylate transport system substrate-binding protein
MSISRSMKMVIGAALISMLPISQASAETLQFQAAWGSGSTMVPMLIEWAGDVSTMTNNRIEIDILPSNAVFAPKDAVESVGVGVIPGFISSLEYFAGKDPAFGLIGNMVTAFDHPSTADKFYHEYDGLKIVNKLAHKHNIHIVGPMYGGAEAFVSSVPIRGVADFKGVKLRAPAGMAHELFTALGAAPVNLPGSEVYTSLEHGVIDAADFASLSMNDGFGMHKFAKYPIYPGIHAMATNVVAMNKDKWDSLPIDLQKTLEYAVRVLAIQMWNKIDTMDMEVAKKLAADKSVEVVDWPESERTKLRGIAQGIWKKAASKNAISKEYYDAAVAYLKAEGKL